MVEKQLQKVFREAQKMNDSKSKMKVQCPKCKNEFEIVNGGELKTGLYSILGRKKNRCGKDFFAISNN